MLANICSNIYFKEVRSIPEPHNSEPYHEEEKCCPLVVDPLCVGAILLSIAGATLLLARTFQIELTMVRRKRSLPYKSYLLEGKLIVITLLSEGGGQNRVVFGCYTVICSRRVPFLPPADSPSLSWTVESFMEATPGQKGPVLPRPSVCLAVPRRLL